MLSAATCHARCQLVNNITREFRVLIYLPERMTDDGGGWGLGRVVTKKGSKSRRLAGKGYGFYSYDSFRMLRLVWLGHVTNIVHFIRSLKK